MNDDARGSTRPGESPDRATRRVAFVDSGLGLVAYADALLSLRPDLGLVLSMDPDHMPYGPRTPDEVCELILRSARSALEHEPDAVVVACNTASVHGLAALRAELEPAVPVIGTVPAIRPAAAGGGPVAVWATAATAASDYLRGLVDAFAVDVETHVVAAHGLAEAIESADTTAVDAAIGEAAALTPAGVRGLVLGCTHYGLVEDRIAGAVGADVSIFDSPVAVARQTLRRIGLDPHPEGPRRGVEAVLLSGRPGSLPASVGAYPAGERLLREPAQRHTLSS
ncbi:glutamate racemase [Intrasporangium oryzae NRRL B-24470]|uniref:Glutamate racemase n=1 Tax=Intrasporangium oryzae NRRL B-24470 TaxID=1386089 RepID=W9G6M3_9MICO|nr:aspartate/glutamate racemase family protein [Intrasporangium oryzae]EWT00957.1 glutamate racemase [Intrasporangium oryzae NRRL B-24470]